MGIVSAEQQAASRRRELMREGIEDRQSGVMVLRYSVSDRRYFWYARGWYQENKRQLHTITPQRVREVLNQIPDHFIDVLIDALTDWQAANLSNLRAANYLQLLMEQFDLAEEQRSVS